MNTRRILPHSPWSATLWLAAGLVLGALLTTGGYALAARDTTPVLPIDDIRAFSRIYELIQKNYVDKVDDHKLLDGAINGMVGGLDPHSSYLNEKNYKSLQEGTSGQFGGLGLEVVIEEGLVRVISAIDSTPAASAGIQAGDLIVRIDETPVQGMSLSDAVDRMRGKVGTSVTLTIARKGAGKPLVFNLKRATIQSQSVRTQLLDSGYGYLRLSQFQERSAKDLAEAVKKLDQNNKGALKGLLLDLRNNPGGLVTSSVDVVSMFVPQGTLVVYTEGRTSESRSRLTANTGDYSKVSLPENIKTVPLVVLVNAGSASASEIVAGALQDHGRAVVVGTRTFGKGSVQTILSIDRMSALKLTTARYFTPKGRSIQARGIDPDIVAEQATLTVDANSNLFRVHEADLDKHLINPGSSDDNAEDIPAPEASSSTSKEKGGGDKNLTADTPGNRSNAEREALLKDYQVQQALNVLKVQQILRGTLANGADKKAHEKKDRKSGA